MSGIKRIKIISNRWNKDTDWRLKLESDHSGIANSIYRDCMDSVGIVLAPGDETIRVNEDEAMARYDWKEGVDIIMESVDGHRMTAQAKFLTYWESTITFEDMKTSGATGAWYTCTAQYYFVGYTRKYWDYKRRAVIDSPVIDFQDWIMVDFPSVRRADAAGLINWKTKTNQYDGRRSSFRYVHFDNIPEGCVVARHSNGL